MTKPLPPATTPSRRPCAASAAPHLVETHIDALPEQFRTVFVLRAVEEMSVEEVATALQVPAATVRTRFSAPARCCAPGSKENWISPSTRRFPLPARAATVSWPPCCSALRPPMVSKKQEN